MADRIETRMFQGSEDDFHFTPSFTFISPLTVPQVTPSHLSLAAEEQGTGPHCDIVLWVCEVIVSLISEPITMVNQYGLLDDGDLNSEDDRQSQAESLGDTRHRALGGYTQND